MKFRQADALQKAAASPFSSAADDGLDPRRALECLARFEKMSDILFPVSPQDDPNVHRVRFFPASASASNREKMDADIRKLMEERCTPKGPEYDLRHALYRSFQMHQYWEASWKELGRDGLGRTGDKAKSLRRNADAILRQFADVPLRGSTADVPLAFSHSPSAVAYAMRKFLTILPRTMSKQQIPGDDLDVGRVTRKYKSLANKIKALIAKLDDRQVKNRIYLARAIATNEPLGLVQKLDIEDCQNHCLNKNFIRSMLTEFSRILDVAAEIDGSKSNLRSYAYKESISAPLVSYWTEHRGKPPLTYAGLHCPFVNFLIACFEVVGIRPSRDALANLDMTIVQSIIKSGLPQYWTPATV